MQAVNGKIYPLWGQFVEKKDEWIGGELKDEGEVTQITDISLKPNGDESAFFEIHGKDFSCGGDVHYLGIAGNVDMKEVKAGWLFFSGYGNHEFCIKKKI